MLTITIDEIIDLQPCWLGEIGEANTREVISHCVPDTSSISAMDCIKAWEDNLISADDCLWLILHPKLIPEPTLHLLACDFAEAALSREREAGREPDARSWAAVETKRRWVAGEASGEELVAAWGAEAVAWDAARAVAEDAARVAAWGAAWGTARGAARDAVWAAARAAAAEAAWGTAWATAKATARAAVWAAARGKQIKSVKKSLTQGVSG